VSITAKRRKRSVTVCVNAEAEITGHDRGWGGGSIL
jgi:hypothetical protein